MATARLKTRPGKRSVRAFLAGIRDPAMRQDCAVVARLMAKATGARPVMWGSSMVGYGKHHYRYASGREGDWFVLGFSPRKQNLTMYIMSGTARHQALLQGLGPHKTGVGCIYVKGLEGLDKGVLERLFRASVRETKRRTRI